MKLEIVIADNVSLAGTVQELFSSLTPEQRVAIATDVMQKFLTEPHRGERFVYEASALEEFRKRTDDFYSSASGRRILWSEAKPEDVRSNREFTEHMSKWKSTRETMIELITKCASDTYVASVQAMVQNDPQIQAQMKIAMDVVREKFPDFVHDAMIAWFVQNMHKMGDGMAQALMRAGNAEALASSIRQRMEQARIA